MSVFHLRLHTDIFFSNVTRGVEGYSGFKPTFVVLVRRHKALPDLGQARGGLFVRDLWANYVSYNFEERGVCVWYVVDQHARARPSGCACFTAKPQKIMANKRQVASSGNKCHNFRPKGSFIFVKLSVDKPKNLISALLAKNDLKCSFTKQAVWHFTHKQNKLSKVNQCCQLVWEHISNDMWRIYRWVVLTQTDMPDLRRVHVCTSFVTQQWQKVICIAHLGLQRTKLTRCCSETNTSVSDLGISKVVVDCRSK